MSALLFAASIFAGNIPFGWWRNGTRKFSFAWICAIHIPVLIIIAARIMMHIPYLLGTTILNVAAFFLGQYSGGKLKEKRGRA
jgi:hypothetical protein